MPNKLLEEKRPLMYIKNKCGPKIDPCGTTCFMPMKSENVCYATYSDFCWASSYIISPEKDQ